MTKRVAENGYKPFVVIRPENEASQSLYKKLGFRKLYTIVRMTFVPYTWREPQEDTILCENLADAVRQQLSINADRNSSSNVDEDDDDDEEVSFTRIDEQLEPIDERPEEEGISSGIKFNNDELSLQVAPLGNGN